MKKDSKNVLVDISSKTHYQVLNSQLVAELLKSRVSNLENQWSKKDFLLKEKYKKFGTSESTKRKDHLELINGNSKTEIQ